MADGTVKAIDQVKPGDEVLATDPETGEKEAKQVEATHGHDDVVLTLVLTTSTGGKREIRTTEDHPFWSETEREFQRADELDPGELVLTADGGSMEVHAVLTEEVAYEPAWNLTVQGLHTYYVVSDPARGPPTADAVGRRIDVDTTSVLVHNCPNVISNEFGTSNVEALATHEVGTAFSGVYSRTSGYLRAQLSMRDVRPSQLPTNAVPGRGGHGVINRRSFGDSRETNGFTMFFEEDGISVHWLSRSVNRRNTGEDYVAEELRGEIMDVIARATGRNVWSR
jgi:hypothetical protein